MCAMINEPILGTSWIYARPPAVTNMGWSKQWGLFLSYSICQGGSICPSLQCVCHCSILYLHGTLTLLLCVQHHSQHMDDDNDNDGTVVPLFSCQHTSHQCKLHLYAFTEDVIYHLGWSAFVAHGSHYQLTLDATLHWTTFNKAAMNKLLATLPKFNILARSSFTQFGAVYLSVYTTVAA